MKYQYKTATGKHEVEVDNGWGGVLFELDRHEYNNNQTETHRHASLDAFNLDGDLFRSGEDIPTEFEANERDAALNTAIEKLKPAQRDLIRSIYFDGIPISDYAKAEGVSQPAISQRLATTIKKLKNLF